MKGIMERVGAALLVLVLLTSGWLDLANTAQGGAIDLRNRITGVRLMEAGIDPYHYKWTLGNPEQFGDVYNNPCVPVSKTTATPALLVLHAPIAVLPYRLGQMAWLLAQWLLLLGVGWLGWYGNSATRRWWWAVFLLGFTYTAAWRLHGERGQAYVLLSFLFALWLTLTRLDRCSFAAGFCAGFLATLRPPFLLLLPFLAVNGRGQLTGAAVGLMLGIALPVWMLPASWGDYVTAMQTNAGLYRAGDDPRPGPQHYPATIEGIPTDTIAAFVVIPYADSSIYALLRAIKVPSFPTGLVTLAILVPYALWLGFSRRVPGRALLPGLAAWMFLVDFFLPAYRDSYNDVLIGDVVMAGLLVPAVPLWTLVPSLIALPVGWYIYMVAPEDAWQINAPTVLFALSATLVLFFFDKREASRKVEAAC